MVLDFSQNNINIIFEITENKSVVLKHFSSNEMPSRKNNGEKWSIITDVHITGEDTNDHCGGKHTGNSTRQSLKYVSHDYYKNESGNKLEFLMTDGVIKVRAHYQFYEGVAALRSWSEVENISDHIVGLEYVSSFAYTGFNYGIVSPREMISVYIPHNSWMREVNWKKYRLEELGLDNPVPFSMKRICVSNTGTWSSKEHLPMGAIEISKYNDTLMWQIEHNGSWHWEISDVASMMYVKISGPTEKENGWHKELKPGEMFESVRTCITVGHSFDSALGEMTKYRRTLIKKHPKDQYLPVIFNDYMNCLFGNPTEEKVIPLIDRAAELGAEYFCIDCGWYSNGDWWDTVGEWQPSKQRFPNGIKKICDYIKAKGMIPGLWLEPEVMGINCELAKEFEDECFFVRYGRRIIDHGRYQLDFRRQKVRDFLTSVIDRLVLEYGVGYIKMDYNIEGGVGTEIDADSFGDGLLQHNRAYLAWLDEIQNKYHDLVIECCSSGGMRMDYAMLSRGQIQSVSDQTNFKDMSRIAAASETAVLPEQAAIWAYPKSDESEREVTLNMVNAMLGRIHLSGHIAGLSKEKLALVKSAIDCYKQYRDEIPQAIPFYPLGLPDSQDEWMCFAHKNKSGMRLFVWRMDTEKSDIYIPLDMEVMNVKVEYPANDSCAAFEKTKGIRVTMTEKISAAVITVGYGV